MQESEFFFFWKNRCSIINLGKDFLEKQKPQSRGLGSQIFLEAKISGFFQL